MGVMANERSDKTDVVRAAIIVIGDEILSGRTQDTNLAYMSTWLGKLGIRVAEARVIADDEETIVATVNELRHTFSYVFTTGGIGPTHDDTTADAIAKAFGVGIDYHPDALAILEAHYEPGKFNEARRRMARIPDGATLIDNPVSRAPGFQIGNVFVMAGIPTINRAMLESVRPTLVGGPPMLSRVIAASLAEGTVAGPLASIQQQHPNVLIGSYPYYRSTSFGTTIVVRATDAALLDAAFDDVAAMFRDLGADPVVDASDLAKGDRAAS